MKKCAFFEKWCIQNVNYGELSTTQVVRALFVLLLIYQRERREKEDFFPLILDFPEVFRYVCLSTIIAESEAVGFVCILSIEDELDDQEFKIAKIASDFLGKQLEA